MYNKIKTTKKPQILTKSVSDHIYQILNETFENDLENSPYEFYVYGEIFEQESVLVICLINKTSDLDAITCILSCDQNQKRKSDDLDQLINFYGEMFEQFSQDSFEKVEFNSAWQQHPKDTRIYYQISRENILLSLQADKLLKLN